ncbi:hypothetical protein VOLCADRAFT_94513 [Volvox carteri f. nagariensis]|uniref:ShKT domain-containing protein n=1 Tax=Volvox carteri f. nagariensis TaxID=3068 RepID=D8U4Z8_VOLCA|nr:uncharacterized protein VOLCADRAFT_94513 [Volvox carteri f. nagariensis]EFJ45358.1 hypothetical protein VOLCADRAFT_94513 [Volvox carteri f. nagariensis]|eukprot:XP_002953734.1 hypothetical protein VOLCADRAFT_94513 [Volvox carteri f. nagariensis]
MSPLVLLLIGGALAASVSSSPVITKPSPRPPPRPLVSPSPPSICADQEPLASSCSFWKSSGYCSPGYFASDQSVVDYWCRKTCGTCVCYYIPPLFEGIRITGPVLAISYILGQQWVLNPHCIKS